MNKVTVAGEVRFHDDISTYTGKPSQFAIQATSYQCITLFAGVHTGGAVPEFSANQNAVTMENLLDRSPADVRGVKVAGGGAAAPRRCDDVLTYSISAYLPVPTLPIICSCYVPSIDLRCINQIVYSLCCSSAPYKPTYAGEANKGGGIYDRLSNQSSYTGVSYEMG